MGNLTSAQYVAMTCPVVAVIVAVVLYNVIPEKNPAGKDRTSMIIVGLIVTCLIYCSINGWVNVATNFYPVSSGVIASFFLIISGVIIFFAVKHYRAPETKKEIPF